MKNSSGEQAYMTWARTKLVEVAQGMLDGSIDFIDGCRRVTELRADAGMASSKTLDVFRGIESETDHYPVGIQRSAYSSEFLKRLDSEISAYLNDARPALMEACREVIREIEVHESESSEGRSH